MQRRHAFTLIELLVVIAIIAILAAILFPVFAQAKMAAKKTAAISQAKQTGTAMLLYAGDVDDNGPCGTVPNLSDPSVIKFRPADAAAQSPAGWFNYPGAQEEHALVWHNTTEPYRKNYDILNPPGTTLVNITSAPWPAGYSSKLKEPKGVNYTYNGLLQSFALSAVAQPSTLPLLWQGTGHLTRNGAAMANPRLNCNGTGPCVFNPAGPPQAGATGQGSFFNILLNSARYKTYGEGNVYIATDSSMKFVKFGNGNQAPFPKSGNSLVPIQFVEPDGTVKRNFIRGRFASDNKTIYTAAFMPDNTFAN